MPDSPSPVRPLDPTGGPTERPAAGGAATAGVMVLLTPVHGFGLVLALLSAGSSDASGRGGPFRACTADSVSCTGPNVPLIVAGALAMLACLGIAVRAGMRTGRLPPRWRHRGMLSCAGVAAAVVVDTVAVLVR